MFIKIWFVFVVGRYFIDCEANGTSILKVPNSKERSTKDFNMTKKGLDEYEELLFSKKAELDFPRNLDILILLSKELKDPDCAKDVLQTLKAFERHEKWTLEMFDSFPKFPTGILTGNHYQLGNFDECINSKQENGTIQGQYCIADIYFNNFLDDSSQPQSNNTNLIKNRYAFDKNLVHWGICLPASCTPKDSALFVKGIFKSVMENVDVLKVDVNPRNCQYESSKPLTTSEIVFSIIIGIFVIFVSLITMHHAWKLRQRRLKHFYTIGELRQNPTTMEQVFYCFSIMNTTQKFLQTKPSELNLECICGIRILSMIFIVGGHSLIFICGGPLENVDFLQKQAVQIKNAIFFNNALLVDTFLIISGFLMCRLLLIELDKRKGKVNFFILYIARYIRLTPAYVVIIAIYCTFLPRLGNGPFWNYRIGLEKERCENSYWANLLYVNNYLSTDQMCMFQSWYLAVDYHLFIIAPFLIYPLWKWKRLGELLLSISIVTSVLIPFWITYAYNYDPTLLAFPPEITDLSKNYYFVNAYIKTHMRGSSYFIGLLFGYLVHKVQNFGLKLSKSMFWLGSFVALLCSTISLVTIVIFYDPMHEKQALESAIYASLHRVAWSMAIGWVIFICVTENASLINRFLSWKFFIPLSRLTYCAYLVNGFIVIYHMGTIRGPTFLNLYELVCKTIAHIILTFVLAFLLCILFESPIHGLEKILLAKDGKRKDKQTRHRATSLPSAGN